MIRSWFCLMMLCLFIPLAQAESMVRPAEDIRDNDIDWIRKVADWQLTQSRWNEDNNWHHGALFTGLMAAYEATKDETYLNATRSWAEKFDWQLYRDNTRHADHHCCGQSYLELFFLDEADPYRLAHTLENNDRIVNYNTPQKLGA